MPIALTTIAPGAATDATTLRTTMEEVQRYVNEATVAGDRTSSWLKSSHVFRPDFQYALASKEVPMPGAHIFWNDRPLGRSKAALFTFYQGAGPFVVPGLSRTIQIPEDIGTNYMVLVRASFVAYEYGGEGLHVAPAAGLGLDNPNDTHYTADSTVANFALQVNLSSPITATYRPICAASDYSNPSAVIPPTGPYLSRFYARKQHTIVYAVSGAELGGAGVHNLQVVCMPVTPDAALGSDIWRHILVTQGVMVARCRLR